MTMEDLVAQATVLEKRIREATPMSRLDLLPEFSGLLAGIRQAGGAVPSGLKALEQALSEELAESQFDNMPV